MVRDFSTGGGHGPEDTLVEGDEKIVTRKWQGYPPENLNLIGKPHPAMPEVGIPRLTGKAEYATRVVLPNMLYIKLLTSPHPRAKVKIARCFQGGEDAGRGLRPDARRTPRRPIRCPEELFFQGEVVAIVAAETEDQAEDAVAAIEVEYELLPSASSLQQAMAPNAPDLSAQQAETNVIKTLYRMGRCGQGIRGSGHRQGVHLLL